MNFASEVGAQLLPLLRFAYTPKFSTRIVNASVIVADDFSSKGGLMLLTSALYAAAAMSPGMFGCSYWYECVCMNIYMSVCMYVFVCLSVCLYTCMYVRYVVYCNADVRMQA